MVHFNFTKLIKKLLVRIPYLRGYKKKRICLNQLKSKRTLFKKSLLKKYITI